MIINYASRRHFKKVRVSRRAFLALPDNKKEILTINPHLELMD
jgi:hypothetical protein